MIPEGFAIIEVGDTTRSVCSELCSETYNQTCSGFLYNRRLQKCELSPYNGEWVTTAGLSFNSSSGLEFYRRRRCLGLIRISSFSFYTQLSVFNLTKNLNVYNSSCLIWTNKKIFHTIIETSLICFMFLRGNNVFADVIDVLIVSRLYQCFDFVCVIMLGVMF